MYAFYLVNDYVKEDKSYLDEDTIIKYVRALLQMAKDRFFAQGSADRRQVLLHMPGQVEVRAPTLLTD